MKTLVIGAAFLAALAAPAAAETRYDRKLEQAVMSIVAKKIGDLRGGFSYRTKPEFVVVTDAMPTGSIGIETDRLAKASASAEELTPEVERRLSRVITF